MPKKCTNYASFGAKNVDLLLARHRGVDGTHWTKVQYVDSITVSRGIVPGSKWYCMKASGRINCAAMHLANKLNDPSQMKIFDDMTYTCRVLKDVDGDKHTTVRHVQTKPIYPAEARDVVVVTTVEHFTDGIVIATRSVDHDEELFPEQKNVVRAKVLIGGYIICPISEIQCEVNFLIHIDCGGRLPALVLNSLSLDYPVALIMRLQALYDVVPYSAKTLVKHDVLLHHGIEVAHVVSQAHQVVQL
ncbi:hypothetical protein LEN26_017554 [Aphanomyces euteiches]|nr:hypothetical protein LEN26_017554 [Aphanomyces euteiches]KAH9114914.1 hypothetical protein AeMF1_011018 [Aphanomyces euteiches]KAH9192289.1 hypothetical protein AeNC1_005729 [Aphanomyces euteiches]